MNITVTMTVICMLVHIKKCQMNFFIRIFKTKKFDLRLLGKWEGIVHGERLTMTFSGNSELEYKIHTKDDIQIIKQAFSTSKDLLVTDQLSQP